MAKSRFVAGKKWKSDLFLNVKPQCRLRVRLIGQPFRVVRIFNNCLRQCAILDTEETGKLLKAKYPKELGDVLVRYDCWCIDRADNKMKILDMPKSVAEIIGSKQASSFQLVSGIHEGCDWEISTNGKTGMDVRYNTVYLEETSLTNKELEMLEKKREGKGGYLNLRMMFNSLTFAEAEMKLIG